MAGLAQQVWERARVLALAPDDASRRAAVPLTAASRWSDSGAANRSGGQPAVLWGDCRGSATYRVSVQPGLVYACNCPSRKSPCKHALALLLRWSAGELTVREPPSYAAPTPGPDATATAFASGPAKAPPDPEAAAQRAAARVERVQAGLAELERWISDQLRGGLADWERTGWAPFEAVAARMVDAQAPGVAGMVRGIPALLRGDDWPGHALDALAALHLLIAAHRGIDRLPPDLAATVRARIGYPVAKATVLAEPGVIDHWWALGSVDVLEGRLESRRVWLWGTTTRRWALLLSFAVPGAGLDAGVSAGDLVSAALHFYPGAGEYRALVGEQWVTSAPPDVPGETFRQARERWAALIAADPWASRMPVVLCGAAVGPNDPGSRWRLRDPDGTAVDLVSLGRDPWPLLALSAGEPVPVFGEWERRGFRPLRVVQTAADPAVAAPALMSVA